MVTAYDAPSARLADEAGIDIGARRRFGRHHRARRHSTVPVTMDEMIVYTRDVVARRAARAPRGRTCRSVRIRCRRSGRSRERDPIRRRRRGADAVKLEGAGRTLTRISAIVDAGIPVMGHIGLTPQSATMLGGYRGAGAHGGGRAQARSTKRSRSSARVVSRSCSRRCPPSSQSASPNAVRVPTIGIGAGRRVPDRSLVWHDVLGMPPGPTPRFVKQYASLSTVITDALAAYARDVRTGAFPEARHTYQMPDAERDRLDSQLTRK